MGSLRSLIKFDGFVKSLKSSFDVIPAKAGIQCFQIVLDACLRRHDGISDFLRVCQIYTSKKGVKLMDKKPRIGGDVNKMALFHPKALGAS